MRKILYAFIFLPLMLLSQTQPFESDRASFDPSEHLFLENDSQINGVCEPACRALKEGYKTRIESFNAKTGVTTCSINRGMPMAQNYHANTYNADCVSETSAQVEFGSGQLSSENKQYGDIAKVLYQSPETITMSRFLAGVATLDPEIVDFEQTNKTGILQLKNSGALYGTNIVDYKTNPRIIATSDAFNKANLAFFSSLFVNMNDIYSYVQNLLFVLIGFFFIAKVGLSKGLDALDVRNGGGGGRQLRLA